MERNDIPMQAQAGMQAQLRAVDECCEKQMAEPTLRDRLEQKRNRLARQLAEVDAALQALYVQPDVSEQVYRLLKRVV